MHLRSLSDEALLISTHVHVAKERAMTLVILQHLREVERRRLYAELKYSSLFDYVTQELKYDNASAMRRIDAMRLLKELPEVEEKILAGSLCLSTVARAQGFCKKEPLALEKKKELVQALENKSTRQVEKTLLGFSQTPTVHLREKIKPVTPEISEVRFYASDELLEQLEKLKGLLAHSHPSMNTGELIAFLAKMGLERLDPAQKKAREKKVVTAAEVKAQPLREQKKVQEPQETAPLLPPKKTSRPRRPPVATIRFVWRRDGGRCVWKNSKTDEVCGSRYRIQLDHVLPFAFGGDHSPENLRCLCATHNKLEAEKWFGSPDPTFPRRPSQTRKKPRFARPPDRRTSK